MNGGRYPRASNPEKFKQARIHIRDISREMGLTTGDIQFDFSINHRDMPTLEIPNQSARLIPCSPTKKGKIKCFSFEDYFPGEKYVDLVGVSFYNRGKGNSDRKRLTPKQIMNDPTRKTLARMKTLKKPIIIDEV
jgi:beta-mannanase